MAATKRVAKAPAAPAVPQYGELSGRLRDLFAKTVKPGPYEVTNKIVVPPPSKGAWEELDRLQNQNMAATFLLSAQIGRIGSPDAPTQADLDEIAAVQRKTQQDYDELFFGSQLAAVKKVAEDWERGDWQAFCDDIKDHFLGRTPDTGSCKHCGHVIDAELAGKDSKPST